MCRIHSFYCQPRTGKKVECLNGKVWRIVILMPLLLGSLLIWQVRGDQPVSKFDANLAIDHVRVLAGKIGPRPAASDQERIAGEYIRNRFSEFGWQVQNQEFSRVMAVDKLSLKKFSLVHSTNIIAVRKGKLPQTIVIGAHYDSADFNVPGANDNASGVGVLLELARVLPQNSQEYTYVLVAFGAEELGLLGSRYFVDNYDLSQVQLMLNLDMIGEGNKVALDGGGKISTPPELLSIAYKEAKKYGLTPVVQRDFMLMARASRDGGTSDFSPFLDKWIPSLGLGQGDKLKAYYHQPTDTLDKINIPTLAAYGNFILDLVQQIDNLKAAKPWDFNYLTVDTKAGLLFISSPVIKAVVCGCLILVLIWLYKFRTANWLSITWIVPGMLVITILVLFTAYLPELGLQKIKGLEEPWHAFPGAYLLLRCLSVALILSWLSGYLRLLPQKILPKQPDVYLAASILVLGIGTIILMFSRWDGAFYLALWLLLIPLSRLRYGLVAALAGPAFLYSLHWRILRSYLWVELYRACQNNFIIATLIYSVLLLPLILSVYGWFTAVGQPKIIARPRVMFIGLCTVLGAFLVLPAYTSSVPQEITVRQEWKEHKLTMRVSSKDRLPRELAKTLQAGRDDTQVVVPLAAALEPAEFKVITTEAKLKDERLITVNIAGSFRKQPYLVKLKLSSDKPFTLVNSGDLFPLGKLGNKVKLAGEPYAGVYGLILERYAPVPQQFTIYLKAQGTVNLFLESQYPDQFVKQQFPGIKALVKYENWTVFSKVI